MFWHLCRSQWGGFCRTPSVKHFGVAVWINLPYLLVYFFCPVLSFEWQSQCQMGTPWVAQLPLVFFTLFFLVHFCGEVYSLVLRDRPLLHLTGKLNKAAWSSSITPCSLPACGSHQGSTQEASPMVFPMARQLCLWQVTTSSGAAQFPAWLDKKGCLSYKEMFMVKCFLRWSFDIFWMGVNASWRWAHTWASLSAFKLEYTFRRRHTHPPFPSKDLFPFQLTPTTHP